MSSFNTSRTSERPTLPSIHSLDLPFMSRPAFYSYENTRSSYLSSPRKTSTSSSNTSMSRSPSPSSSSSSRDTSPTHGRKLRLVPCLLEEADAVIVVPAPSPTSSGKPIMVMGSAMQQLRTPQRPLTKGARMHPYRIVGSSTGSVSRRTSMASMVSLPEL